MGALIAPQPTRGEVEVIGLLAEGGMSEVYLGRVSHLGEDMVVLKRLPPDKSRDPEMVRMFKDEARISRLVSGHPNIVQYLDEGELDGSAYIALELVDGLTVAEILNRSASKRTPVPAPIVINIALGLLEALIHAHAATDEKGEPLNIIHRDVTPQNVVITWSGEVKLLDFGVSKSTGRSQLTEPGLVKGKPFFMAPEQLEVKDLDHRVDLFALAVVLYFLLTLRHPCEGHDGMNVLLAIVEGKQHDPRSYVPELPESLCQDLMRALAIDPDDRFSDAAEMKEALLTSQVQAGSQQSVRDFLQGLDAKAPNHLRKAPSLHGDKSWHAFRPQDTAEEAAVEAVRRPYQATDINTGDLDAPEPVDAGAQPPEPPITAEARPLPTPVALPPSRPYRAVWALVWVLSAVLVATWAMRLLAMTPPAALIVDSDNPHVVLSLDEHPITGTWPFEMSEWPTNGPILLQWSLRGVTICETMVNPRAGRTVRARCRIESR